jgi:hypothetical protein
MNKDKIWQQIKNDKTIIYNEPILDIFIKLNKELSENHYNELTKDQKKIANPEVRLKYSTDSVDIKNAVRDGAKENLHKVFEKAVRDNNFDLIKFFVEETGIYHLPALRAAGKVGDLKTVSYLLDKKYKEKEDPQFDDVLPPPQGYVVSSVFEGAIQNGNINIIKYLVEKYKRGSSWNYTLDPEVILSWAMQEILNNDLRAAEYPGSAEVKRGRDEEFQNALYKRQMEILDYLSKNLESIEPIERCIKIYNDLAISAESQLTFMPRTSSMGSTGTGGLRRPYSDKENSHPKGIVSYFKEKAKIANSGLDKQSDAEVPF